MLTGKRRTHNGMIVIKCFRQSSLLTREHLVFTSTLTNTYKPLAEFVVVDRGSGARCYAWPSTSRATRVTLDVITPSPTALTPEKWKQTATLCPLDWPSNYSLLRLWHVTKDLHQFVDQLRKQMNHRHMFSHWEVSFDKFTSRVLYQLPAHYAPEATLQQHVQNRDFPSRRVRKKPPRGDIDEIKAKCSELRRLATAQPVN